MLVLGNEIKELTEVTLILASQLIFFKHSFTLAILIRVALYPKWWLRGKEKIVAMNNSDPIQDGDRNALTPILYQGFIKPLTVIS